MSQPPFIQVPPGVSRLVANRPVREAMDQLRSRGVANLTDVVQPAQTFLGMVMAQQVGAPCLVFVVDSLRSQERAGLEVDAWMDLLGTHPMPAPDSTEVAARRFLHYFPPWDVLPSDGKLPHLDVLTDRLRTLVSLSEVGPGSPFPVVVVSVDALIQRTFTPACFRSMIRRLAVGESVDPLDLVEWLEEMGYEPEARVSSKGELSLRGGILDLFPPTQDWPVRVDFFGSDIESIRLFDPGTQVSRETVGEVMVGPAGEFSMLKRFAAAGAEGMGSLLDWLPLGTLMVLCEPEALRRQSEAYERQITLNDPLFLTWEGVRGQVTGAGIRVLELAERAAAEVEEGVLHEETSPVKEGVGAGLGSLDAFRPLAGRAMEPQVAEVQRREFFAQVHRWIRQGYDTLLLCNNVAEQQRFKEIWVEYGLPAEAVGTGPDGGGGSDWPGGVQFRIGALRQGFLADDARLVVISDAEVFGRYKVPRPRRMRAVSGASSLKPMVEIDFADFQPGDYVVHVQHGIGQFRGLEFLSLAGGKKAGGQKPSADPVQECLVIEYAAAEPGQSAPRLYVPVSEAHLVSKYIGAGKARPVLNTLGGSRWAKAKKMAEEAVRDLAADLLSIQAVRDAETGHAFPPDSAWQREFENAFLYQETPDQLRAIEDAKRDMERPKPMDRLVCGDVGFGKTEVAIRAAFKAVMGGRQVAVLVPTTVLAQQHYNTFRERMADYPVRVELMSRFRTRKEIARVSAELASGGVDIVIGTHRLVQGDVTFKDLGLVVIDEEQRFGVIHKERLKQLRRTVDVVTLSATPIPRTLYLALAGARDLSLIQTPPLERLPVETTVCAYDERVIRDAIQRELNRGGQVFFLHNRVGTIDAMAVKIRALVPQARVVVGHGQMPGDELEEVMTRFVNGEADVLLSTTIIESGLDIPNANTMIIDRADRFGLSDLYQLRGRVGRYKHQAYAYLLLPRHATLLADARKRISAIKQYSSLGSGFKIAMRDLEIRGAGNLLGAQQSGHITAIGFDLYCQLLKQSVSALKGEKIPPRIDVRVRLDFLPALSEAPRRAQVMEVEGAVDGETESGESAGEGAGLPLSYIQDSRQRIEIYRRLAEATRPADVAGIRTELADRFGAVPPPVELLLLATELKVLAAAKGVSVLETREERLMLTRNGDYIMLGGKFPRLSKPTARGRLTEIRKLLQAL